MSWKKKGLIFNSHNHFDWAVNGAMIPTPVLLDSETVRVFVTMLDADGIGRTGYVDLDVNELSKVKHISSEPVFDTGMGGTFDENGALTCSVTSTPKGYHLYYAGFEIGTKIRYRLMTGLVIMDDSFQTLKKYKTPVLDRTQYELFFRCGPFCLYDDGVYKMWYVAGSDWTEINGKMMPVYVIKYIESLDGILWPEEGKECISIDYDDEHGFGRPYVIRDDGLYKMFYSIRKKGIGYRLGYAESYDGVNWTRKDSKMNDLNVSDTGWDSEMIAYSAVIKLNDKFIMFYNGNGFGKTGFGYAEWVNA